MMPSYRSGLGSHFEDYVLAPSSPPFDTPLGYCLSPTPLCVSSLSQWLLPVLHPHSTPTYHMGMGATTSQCSCPCGWFKRLFHPPKVASPVYFAQHFLTILHHGLGPTRSARLSHGLCPTIPVILFHGLGLTLPVLSHGLSPTLPFMSHGLSPTLPALLPHGLYPTLPALMPHGSGSYPPSSSVPWGWVLPSELFCPMGWVLFPALLPQLLGPCLATSNFPVGCSCPIIALPLLRAESCHISLFSGPFLSHQDRLKPIISLSVCGENR